MNEPNVFISYSRDDAEWAHRFAESLRDQSVNVWLDAWQIHAGEHLREAIDAGLRNSDAIVSIISPDNAQRPSVLFELGAALAMGKRLIPIIPAGLDSAVIPFELRNRRFITKGSPDEVAREVADALKREAA